MSKSNDERSRELLGNILSAILDQVREARVPAPEGSPCKGQCEESESICMKIKEREGEDGMWSCTLNAYHDGPHIACSIYEHNVHTWEDNSPHTPPFARKETVH